MQKLWISAPSFLLPRGQSNNWRRLLLQYVDWIHLVYPGQGTSWDIITGVYGWCNVMVYGIVPCCPMVLWKIFDTKFSLILSVIPNIFVFPTPETPLICDQHWLHAGLTLCVLLLSFVLSFIKTKFDIDAMPSPSPTHWSKRSYPDCTWHFALKVSDKSLKWAMICILYFLYLSMRREKAVFTSTEPSVGPFIILYCGLLQIFIQSFL